MDGLEEDVSMFDEPEYPDIYEIDPKLKSPISVLWYNLTYEFPDKYPAKMNPDFARDMIKIYSKPDAIVWDGCVGSGTVARIANQLNRKGFGTDVNPKAIDLAQRHDPEHLSNYWVEDAMTVDGICDKKVDLILSSLPFGLNIAGDKNHYSDENKDISNSESYEKFFDNAEKIIQSYFQNLKPLGICVLDARDRTKEGKLWDLVNYFRNIGINAGFDLMARYTYFLMPYRTMTYKHRPEKSLLPMVSAMDAIVLIKPENEKLM